MDFSVAPVTSCNDPVHFRFLSRLGPTDMGVFAGTFTNSTTQRRPRYLPEITIVEESWYLCLNVFLSYSNPIILGSAILFDRCYRVDNAKINVDELVSFA